MASQGGRGWLLRVRDGSSAPVQLSVDPETTSTAELMRRAAEALDGGKAIDGLVLPGTPPSALAIAADLMLKDTALQDRSLVLVSRRSAASVASTSSAKEVASAATAASAPRRRARGARQGPASTDDFGIVLAESHGRGARGAQAKKFRKATREARKVQEEVSKANRRFAAALGGKYTLSLEPSGRLGRSAEDNEQVLKVMYGQRPPVTETYRVMDAPLVQQVILDTLGAPVSEGAGDDPVKHPREKLRPDQMALYSPACFWNVVRLKGHQDLNQALCDLAPNADLRFLATRVRRKSAKARENEQVERMLRDNGEGDDGDEEDVAEPEDDLITVFDNVEDRILLRDHGITSVERLADMLADDGTTIDARFFEDYYDLAREKLIERWMREKIVGSDAFVIYADRLRACNILTPKDVSMLRVPGRTEFLTSELGLTDRSLVNSWRTQADALLVAHSWLSEYRTAG